MYQELTCEQVSALLSFYVEDKLSDKLSKSIWEHLQNCPECMNKFNQLKNIYNKFIDIQNQELENPYITNQYKNFKSNLSAYIDNELSASESIKIKKFAISNPIARQDLENIYTFKKLIHSSFEKTKNDFKNDYCKNILSNIHNEKANNNNYDSFYKLSIAFGIMITLIVTGLICILYF